MHTAVEVAIDHGIDQEGFNLQTKKSTKQPSNQRTKQADKATFMCVKMLLVGQGSQHSVQVDYPIGWRGKRRRDGQQDRRSACGMRINALGAAAPPAAIAAGATALQGL